MKVLVVDDNAANRKYLRILLMHEGHAVLEAEDGLEALLALDREKNIDAVLSDVLMPRMDGYRLCYEIRKNPQLNPIPFIAYSAAYISSHDEQVALDFGADRFLMKPALPEVIIEALHEAVKKRESRAKEFRKPDELSAMKEYSETLVRKLEETNTELSRANHALNERAVLAEFIADISNALNHSETLPVILQLCTEAMVRRLDAAFARIWTHNPKDHVLELQASAGMYTHIDGGHSRVPVGKFKIGLIASERKPHLTNSVVGDPRVNDQEWAKREGMVAFAGYPLLVEEKLVGVMAMFSRKPLMASTLQTMESVSKAIAASILRKRSDEEKQQETERSRAILETALDCVVTMDHEGKILEFNPTAEKTFGYARSAVIGKDLAELIIPPHLREQHRRGLAHYLTTGHGPMFGKRLEITAIRSDKTEFPVELIINPMSIGGRTTFTGFIRDISERKRAEEHIQRNIERMAALREIEKSITSTLDLNTVLNVLLEKIDIFFAKSSAATVRLFDRDTGQLEPVAARNIEIGEWVGAMRGVHDNSKSYARVVIDKRAPLLIPNLQTDSRTQNPHFYREHGLISYAGVPLLAKGEVLGVLGIYTKEEHTFSGEEIELLMILAGQTAIAIHNARLYERAQRQLKRMQGVSEINKAITSTLSLKNVLDVLLEKTELFCPVAVACGVRLFDETSGNMVPMASCHLPFEEWQQDVGNAKGRLTAILMETQRPTAILNMHTGSRRSVNHFARKHGLISYLGVPLIFREKFMGNLVIYTKEEHAFSDEEIEFFTNLGSQAAIAIHNASLYEQTERRRRETEELARIGRSLTETLDIVAVGSRIVTSVRELFHVKGSTLRILEADGSLRKLASSGDSFSLTHEGEVIPWDMGIIGRAIKEESPIWSADITTNEEITLSKSMRDYSLRSGNCSVVVVPLRAHEKVTGTLTLTDQTGRAYSENELLLLQTFANQAAMALVNGQLFETIAASKQQLATINQFLEHSLDKLGSLYTAMTPLALSESLSEMVNAIIERLMEATGADAALIRIWDRHDGNYPVIGQRGYTDDFVESLRPDRSEGGIQWVIKHGEPIIAPDVSLEARFLGKRQMTLGFKSSAILPLRVHGDTRGVIQLSSRKQGFFDDEQKDHLMAVARQMSVALENRELFYNLQASRNELEHANKVKDEFLNVMSHELRTPLGIIIGYSTLLREQQLGPLTKGQEDGIGVIQRNSKELFTMLDSIMNATKIEAGSMIPEKETVSPVELFAELKVLYDFPTGKKIRFEWKFSETLPPLWTDARKLRQILTNLINNAVKFTDEGSIVISAEEKLEGNDGCHLRWIEFRVSDSGIGIPAEERDKIFERFHQVDSSATRSFEGVGLGLYIVKSFAEMLKGQISVSSEVGHGSTFTVRIPLESIPVARGK